MRTDTADARRSRSSGLYGLLHLDGTPTDPVDLVALGIAPSKDRASCQFEGYDAPLNSAVHQYGDTGAITWLVGDVTEPGQLAARLGLGREAPIALIARTALHRFGSDTPVHMLGEWSLLHSEGDGHLTLMLGPAVRDRLMYAHVGNKLAFAPNLPCLARLNWVDKTIDPAGLMLGLGRAPLRSAFPERTMLAQVSRLGPGDSLFVNGIGRITRSKSNALIQVNPSRGAFADVVLESEALLRKIMREKLASTPLAVSMLSGGLDSSLLAWLAANEHPAGRTPIALTSAAPPDSGIPDESAYAQIVAEHLGLVIQRIYPAHDVDTYRPTDAILSGASGPVLSNRHCLADAFQLAARQAGATTLIDGTYGEMSVTARLYDYTLTRKIRAFARAMLGGWRAAPRPTESENPFHVRLARHRLAALPEPVHEVVHRPESPSSAKHGPGALGYITGIEKGLLLPNEFYPGAVRVFYPFRDVRLLRLFAAFPVKTLLTGGHDRPVVRAMLKGNLPDSIRLRRSGMPASPDHLVRLQRQAEAARQRIAAFRAAEIDDWLDLDWLDTTLASVSRHGVRSVGQANEVQLTAINAEFLLWWRTQF